MITAPLINWQPMSSMPDDRKDGRQMLLAFEYENGTINAGPRHWLYETGRWYEERWIDIGDGHRKAISRGKPDHWADINPPE